MRKDFIPFFEFEQMMYAAGWSEVMFLREARLGIYTVREWRRHHEAPAWALRFCEMAAELRGREHDTKDKNMDPVLLAMTEEEMLRYGTLPKHEMLKLYDMVKARMAGEPLIG